MYVALAVRARIRLGASETEEKLTCPAIPHLPGLVMVTTALML